MCKGYKNKNKLKINARELTKSVTWCCLAKSFIYFKQIDENVHKIYATCEMQCFKWKLEKWKLLTCVVITVDHKVDYRQQL